MITQKETLNKTFYLFGYPRPYREEKFSIEVTDVDMRGESEWVFLKEFEVSVEVPEGIDLISGQVASLENEKQKIMADYQIAIDSIDEKINSLLAIEHKE